MKAEGQAHGTPRGLGRLRRLDGAAIFVLALVVNSLAALFVAQPLYMDAYYYFDGALQLARGQGLVEPYLWNYLDPVLRLPHPSHLYWMPLASLVAAPFIALAERLFGPGLAPASLFRAAQVPSVLAASALPLLSYAAARLATGRRRHAVVAALLTIFSAFYLLYWPQTDAFALFALVAAGALLAAYVGLSRGAGRWLFLGGLGAGLAHLTRTDGVLVLMVVLAAAVVQAATSAPRAAGAAGAGRFGGRLTASLRPLGLLTGGYLLIMLPWFVRNVFVMGTPLLPGGARLLWLTDYNELYNYPAEGLTLAHYLAAGWPAILQAKWSAGVTNFGNVLGPLCNIAAFPFILAGFWQLRRHALYGLAAVYGGCLFGLMTLVFTLAGARGGFFHSGAALLPFFCPAAVVGIDAAVEAAARRLPHWQPEKSKPVFNGLLVLVAAGLTARVSWSRMVGVDWRHPAVADAVYGEIGRWLDGAAAPGAAVAVNNPPGFFYFTGRPSIVIPNGAPETLLRAARDFNVRWVALDANVPAGLAGLYADPASVPHLVLRHTFTDAAQRAVYVLEVEP